MPTNKSNLMDAVVLFGGLLSVLVVGAAFVLFPMYQLLDMTVVRRPIWDPPRVVVRESLQGLRPEDVARLEQVPQQRVFLEKLKKPIIFEPKPSWLGYRKPDPNKPVTGRQYPPNRMLHLLIGSVAIYVYALKYRGIL
ncbi:MAG: hypothetical protein SFV81_24025 [Pirellulaceae bacterium]|nr:hypothetical protein [Pirellulaceae bacterium]